MSELKQFPLFSVEITRGKDVITCDKPEHEIRVLRVIHDMQDAPMVKVFGPVLDADGDPETIELSPDRDAEFDRLVRTYQRVNAPNPVTAAFANGAVDLDRYGFGQASGPVVQKPGSLIKKHPKPKPAKGDGKK